jgi:alkylhydroperoxidase family enzyme
MAHDPGRYNIQKLGHELTTQVPALLRGLPQLVGGLAGPDRLGLPTRLAFQIRSARLMGCPVCLELFPRIAPRAGLDAAAVERIKSGELDGLSPEVAGAVAWADAVVTRDGAEPELVPGAAMALNTAQRGHLLFVARLELVVHAAGLMLLPHDMIQQALLR